MTIFRFSLFAAVASLLACAASAQRASAGEWQFSFSPSEKIYKLIYSKGSEGGLYFRCEPGSGSVNMIHNLPAVDVRKYKPNVVWAGAQVNAPYEIDWEDYGGGVYYFDMKFSSESKLLQILPFVDRIIVDDVTYPVSSKDEIVMFQEFLRVCAK
jgi:hypothetical protein